MDNQDHCCRTYHSDFSPWKLNSHAINRSLFSSSLCLFSTWEKKQRDKEDPVSSLFWTIMGVSSKFLHLKMSHFSTDYLDLPCWKEASSFQRGNNHQSVGFFFFFLNQIDSETRMCLSSRGVSIYDGCRWWVVHQVLGTEGVFSSSNKLIIHSGGWEW